MILIKNAHVVDAKTHTDKMLSLLLQDGKIQAMEESIDKARYDEAKVQVIDAKGSYVLPGLIDVHVHFRDPGFTYKEDIATGAQAAAKGGFTSVVMMANTKPAVDNIDTLRYVLNQGKAAPIHVYACATITKGLLGRELTDMEALRKEGAAGFTDDGIPILDEQLLRAAMERAAQLGVVLSLHEENPEYIENNGVNAGGAAARHYQIGGSDRRAEISMIDRDLELALQTGAVLNIQHISTKEGVELVRQAKRRGKHIHAEATPHHFTLTEEAVIEHGTLAKMNPPLRLEEDRQAIIEGLKDGTIDLIATDHAPHSREEKEKPITLAPSGIIGLETALPLAVTHLVREGHLTMEQLVERMSLAPARLYGIDAGYLAPGGAADLVIVDMERQHTVGNFRSKSDNSPFTGQKLYGTIEYTIADGRIVYQREE
ncbi:MAG: dihydroorotase [Lachnospiraceae bacterium]|nr:dihydroorotase [Lachnospiraceae bacterium]